jgi:hypothetical protein
MSISALSVANISPLSARIFTSLDGRTMDADLHSMEGSLVRFKGLADGRVYEVSLDTLSVKDQSFIRNERDSGRLTLVGYEGLNLPTVAAVEKDDLHFNASKQIDQILAKYGQTNGVEPAEIVDDPTYLRRAYLKIIGRIPTHAEAVHFLNDTALDKRSRLVDKLLDSPGYVSHNYNLWADVLRVKTTGREGSRYGGIFYAQWLKDQIRNNVPYDDFVASMITAEGYPWENGATGYYLRDSGMPLDNMAMTAQIFLGTQMQCAQCHNHPTDKWTQKEFYELSAFTYGINTRINTRGKDSELSPVMRKVHELAKKENDGTMPKYNDSVVLRTARDFLQPLNWGVEHTNRNLKLPADYQYDDAAPQSIVSATVLYGDLDASELHDSSARVDTYADWMVSQNNERFTKVIANRLWKHAMGKGLIEPVDNLTDASVAQSPELMAFLISLMKGVDYDMKQFLRVVYNTDHFQRAAVIDNPDLDDDYHLEGPLFARMSSEQIWDSLATLMTPDIDTIFQQSYKTSNQGVNYESNRKPAAAAMLEEKSPQEIVDYIDKLSVAYKLHIDLRSEYAALRSDPKLKDSKEGKTLQQRSREATKTWRAMMNPDDSATEGTEQMGMSMMMSNTEMIQDPANRKGSKNQQKWMSGIRRASELQSPQANGHLLEVFGQSDRLLIENADDSGNVLQALFLMNSWQTNGLLANNSAPVVEARLAKTVEEKIETLYIGFLSRKPTEQETAVLVEYYKKDPQKARERIIWAMMNTQQFLFIQ